MGCIVSTREKAHDKLDRLEHHIQENHPHLRRIVSDMPPSEEKPLVLVTGATGYIGGHIVQHLLDAGYKVRATARSAKVEALKEKLEGKVDVVPVEDLATGDYTEALKDVSIVIHSAAPMVGRMSVPDMFNFTKEGTQNLLRQALTAGVKRVIITSSVASMVNPNCPEEYYSDRCLNDKDWGPITEEEALAEEHDPLWNYCCSKVASEKEVWKFAEAYPQMDITTIHPSFVYGPFVPGSKFAKGDFGSLSTVAYFWQTVLPEGGSSTTIDRVPHPVCPFTVDVRDVARAHILALTAPLTSEVGRKRIIVTGPNMLWFDAVVHLRKAMPELIDRFPSIAEGAEEKPQLKVISGDMKRAEELLGMKASEMIDWRKTAEDTVKWILECEKDWKSQ